ncbi:MAG: type ISP restriction/modification enzyme [Bacteroidia bacterium]
MTVSEYIENLNKRYQLGNATEHTFRGDLQSLIESLVPEVAATNEPKRIQCGAPDYVITRKDIPIGFIEAKDVGTDLSSKSLKEQFDRYKASLNNLIITDYLDFHLYIDGAFVTSIRIGEIYKGAIIAKPENLETFENLIKDFCLHIGQTIKSSKRLAEMMAAKARMLSDVIEKSLNSDEDKDANSSLKDQMTAFKQILIHDIKPKEFADVYAQTIAYGMFAARLHDPTLETFTRQEAAELIPKSNPFLRKLFGYIAGPDIDDRIKWIVASLADVFRASDVAAILKNFGKSTQTQDPIIHFYETFLSEYDPKLRKARGVWYTPEPVVNFIVRAVDDILKTEFDLPQGLADTSKTKIKVNVQGKKVEQEVHRVQILDPATGTGTFLAEVIKQIHAKFEGQKGIWSNYVENQLLPRLNGFELLMASYAMAHLKLDLLLTETGYKPTRNQRFKVYLTNSLEEHHPETGTLFANWLSSEANEANQIKRDTPVMCVIGNPPYAVSSNNKSIDTDGHKTWIGRLIDDYKKNLNERKINLDDDYIKFIRYGQYFIDKNGSGVLAYISNNSFIDGITHRQMRKSLLECFNKIYILDLHGSSKKNEVSISGGKDENVFDIQQGVSINIFIKYNQKKQSKSTEVLHSDIFGLRKEKYLTLASNSLKTIKWDKLTLKPPYHFFVPKDYNSINEYNKGFQFTDLFVNYNSGIQTKNDSLSIQFHQNQIEAVVNDFKTEGVNELKIKYNLKDTSGWTVLNAKNDLLKNEGNFYKIYYRPFDLRYIYMTNKSGGFVGRPRMDTMRHFLNGDNYGLITVRQQSTFDFQHILISNTIMESGAISLQTKEWGYIFPLYLYPVSNSQLKINQTEKRIPNLNIEIIKLISDKLGFIFSNEKEISKNSFAPIDILDYIYAVLYSPKYREKYKEYLKIDFPRVPYPKDQKTFWALVKLGSELRQIHLLDSPVIEKYITQYPIDGDNIVVKPIFKDGKVYINETQYFEAVPEIAWNFYIGGYQPAQKWLKDRKDRVLDFDDILHYQKIIVALFETDRIMKKINQLIYKD